ncbi:CMGC/MAPK protein kinase [Thecamonas trahens ATCC 50062]|uniref:CMGC/MAPK protein kinase n=1 Tax=Thecamonas trahens ATCC 50062 TaxID=461836 RepID=A0A0L0DGR4_THETB|nr:CMGC/MAPK protein kinase [Thecamonas trahens ATCC 50062]KNC51534.1 CMGC/MAPK protein kinase [Thecamonas trahens ATCC 50062]|eukprot:XP_013755936.1 CMGC/MAPK protein kinase [Thecamonas trahens ATCC 50062]
MALMYTVTVHGREEMLVVDGRYRVEEVLGAGTSGVVARAVEVASGKEVAVKKLSRLMDAKRLSTEALTLQAKRTLRELAIQGVLDHPNILALLDVMPIAASDATSFTDLYLVVELVDVDLRSVLASSQSLTSAHYVFFAYQILKALKYLHSAGCMHRDLKPDNCLTNAHCVLKICDFGLAKQHIVPDYEAVVVTRAYRAPELFLDPYNYSEAIDMWAVGMMILEFLSGDARPWLDGPTDLSQLNLILDTFGPPPSDLVDQYPADARSYILGYTFPPFVPLSARFPDAPPDLLDLATRLLDMDWRTRLSAADALDHPVFDTEFRDRASEIEAPHQLAPFDFELAPSLDASTIRALLFNEMLRFHPEAASHQAYTADLYSMLHPSPGPPSEPVPAAMATSPNYAFGSEPATSMAFPDDEPEFMSGGAAVGMDMGTPTLT